VYELKNSITKAGNRYGPTSSYIVPLDQPQYRLARAIFETRTSFNDSLFYEVSTWTIPLAYNLKYASLNSREYHAGLHGNKVDYPQQPLGKFVGSKGAYAYAIEPYGYYAFRSINRLLERKVVVQMLHETHSDADRTYPKGTMIIPIGIQEDKRSFIESTIDKINKEDAVDVFAITTGLATNGVDIGTRSNTKVEEPKVAILVDRGMSSYEAGEVWHLMDQRLKMKITLLPMSRVNSMDLDRYNRIIIPNGSLSTIRDSGVANLKKWVEGGGVIISWKNGGKWLSDKEITKVSYKKNSAEDNSYKPYDKLDEYQGAQVTGGSIFEAKVDLTHPLGYGLEADRIPLFRNHNLVMEKSKNAYANPLVYSSAPLISGYVSDENLERFKNSPAVTVSTIGRGRVITLTDNPNFRAFWFGTNKIFMNALFFGKSITSRAGE
jgi:hypothetical protein